MITIVQFTKIGNKHFFFAEGSNKSMSSDYVQALVDMGKTNISQEQFSQIVGA